VRRLGARILKKTPRRPLFDPPARDANAIRNFTRANQNGADSSESKLESAFASVSGMACEKKFLTLESASPVVARVRCAQKKFHARHSGNATTQNNMLQKSLIDAGFCDGARFMWA
jgi:hypothetical protein